jgi:hypothetical protein
VAGDQIWIDESFIKEFGTEGIELLSDKQLSDPYSLRLAQIKR